MTQSVRLTRESAARRRTYRLLSLALILLALALALLASASVSLAGNAKPAKPTAKAPSSTITSATPTFVWGKASRATKYELRVYQSSTLLFKKTGLTKVSWVSTTALPANVDLTWKVRGSNARGAGAWSKSLTFKVVPPGPAKAITAFSFASPPATGAITEADHTIALHVPFGTNVSALVASFTTTGATVRVGGTLQTSGVTANDFSSPVTYTVTAGDAST